MACNLALGSSSHTWCCPVLCVSRRINSLRQLPPQAARGSWYASSNSWSSPSQTEQRDESAITIGSRDEDVVESSTSNRNMIDSLREVPRVSPPDEILRGAIRRSKNVGVNIKIKNEAAKARSLAARQMDALMKGLSVPLTGYIEGFPKLHRLHPFDAALLELTVTEARYTSVLSKVNTLRRSMSELGKSYASRAANAANKKNAQEIALEGYETMSRVYGKSSKCVQDLLLLAIVLRKLPILDSKLPTIALVGAPNVGKSSLVQAISTGKPEICDYPFTTRSIKMGHFFVGTQKHQITDTPGLLNRSDEERNAMEKLTLATLQYLPTYVVYMIDLTEECGTKIADQMILREKIQAKFPSKRWLDVFSKEDLLQGCFEQANVMRMEDQEILPFEHENFKPVHAVMSLPKALTLSCVTGNGLKGFKEKILSSLQERHEFVGDSSCSEP